MVDGLFEPSLRFMADRLLLVGGLCADPVSAFAVVLLERSARAPLTCALR
jgi:hypothetical protein